MNGFSKKNQKIVLDIAKEDGAGAGFIDFRCTWESGQMATLDVNKSVYSIADKHYIYSDRNLFTHLTEVNEM